MLLYPLPDANAQLARSTNLTRYTPHPVPRPPFFGQAIDAAPLFRLNMLYASLGRVDNVGAVLAVHCGAIFQIAEPQKSPTPHAPGAGITILLFNML